MEQQDKIQLQLEASKEADSNLQLNKEVNILNMEAIVNIVQVEIANMELKAMLVEEVMPIEERATEGNLNIVAVLSKAV